jgi:hypothetical protein
LKGATLAIDTPATIAVIGAGPIGLEAALYGRFLGYDVAIFEQEDVAAHVRRWGHLPMFTPFGKNRSNLGLAAIKAQDANWLRPDDDAILSGNAYLHDYLLPLAQTDLLSDHLHLHSEVIAVGRESLLKGDLADGETRGDGLFRLLIRSTDLSSGMKERTFAADIVIDTSGVFGTPNWLGEGGMPAVGETAARSHIEYGLPDFEKEHARYAGKQVLVVGDGDSAATNVVALAELARHSPDTWITWLTCRELSDKQASPLSMLENDLLPARSRLRTIANALAQDDSNHITWLKESWVDGLVWHSDLDHFQVRLKGQEDELQIDRIIANVGYRPNFQPLGDLHLSVDAFTEATPAALLLAEPNLYVLGAKSQGRTSQFTIEAGLNQIRDLYRILGDRTTLDLYASVINLI